MKSDFATMKDTIRKLTYVIIRELINDFSIFNRFPELKTHQKGIKIHGCYYNKSYYDELISEMRTDFVKGLCLIYSIDYEDFMTVCFTTMKMYDIGPVKLQTVLKVRFKNVNLKRMEKGILDAIEKLRKVS